MHITDRATLAELIADCAAIPVPSQPADQPLPPPHAAEPWQVDDACYAQVSGLEDYV